MNWGTKIAIVYTIFAVVMISAAVYCAHQDIQLVTKDYYEKELVYESHIQKVRNAQSLENPLKINFQPVEKNLLLEFPTSSEAITGMVVFYRPSNSRLDREYAIELTDLQQQISTEDLKSGLWKVKVEWASGSEQFFQEKSIYIQ